VTAARRTIIVTVLLAVGPFWLAAHAGAQTASISGRVIDQDRRTAVAGALVRVTGTGLSATTSGIGAFTISGLTAGVHELRITAPGYTNRADSITVTDAEDVAVLVAMSPDPIALEPIQVEARIGTRTAWLGARGFFQRAQTSSPLLHSTREQLLHQNVRNVRDILLRTPGVRIRRLVDGGGEVLLEPSPLPDAAPCRVGIFLNGSEVEFGTFVWTGAKSNQRASRPLRFDDLLPLEDVDAIELYGPEEMPVAGEMCGALFLWSARIRGQVDEPFVGALRGVAVHDRSGRRISGVRITLEPSGITILTDDHGEFQLPDLVPGEYRLLAEIPGGTPWTGTVRVRAYGTVSVELRM
jgi:hypothetical protein